LSLRAALPIEHIAGDACALPSMLRKPDTVAHSSLKATPVKTPDVQRETIDNLGKEPENRNISVDT
jgi:hypothetical protein